MGPAIVGPTGITPDKPGGECRPKVAENEQLERSNHRNGSGMVVETFQQASRPQATDGRIA